MRTGPSCTHAAFGAESGGGTLARFRVLAMMVRARASVWVGHPQRALALEQRDIYNTPLAASRCCSSAASLLRKLSAVVTTQDSKMHGTCMHLVSRQGFIATSHGPYRYRHLTGG